MNIVLLFDASAYEDLGNYWWATRDLVFSTEIIQSSDRHMRLSVGDVIVGFHQGDDREKIYQGAFLSSEWQLINERRLLKAFKSSVIFGMMFENMPTQLAEKLHQILSSNRGYLGVVSAHFELGPHLALYRNRLPLKYRLKGTSCRAFISMGVEDDKDQYDLEEMRRLGYVDVEWEDKGAHRTIFDDFDTLSHFSRVSIFRKEISELLLDGDDEAYELVMVLEDLSPKLFNSLSATIERLVSAENEEEVAQAALSSRRYIEQLADVLFPPTDEKRSGRSLGKEAYKNRLWAFVEDNSNGDVIRRDAFGKEIDRLVTEINVGVHSDMAQPRLKKALADIAVLTAELLSLSPEVARKPYFAFQSRIIEFFRESMGQDKVSKEIE